MKSFFPNNAVEYFVSYYDYYQPEAYVPRTDTYIEKEASINEQIDRMRHSRHAGPAGARRRDHRRLGLLHLRHRRGRDLCEDDRGPEGRQTHGRQNLMRGLIELQYRRNDAAFSAAPFGCAATAWRSSRPIWRIAPGGCRCFGDELEAITEFDPLTGREDRETGPGHGLRQLSLCHAANPTLQQAVKQIKAELKQRLAYLHEHGKLLEAQRLEQRTTFDHGDDRGHRLLRRASRTIRATLRAAPRRDRRRPCSSTCPTTPC